LECTNKDQVDPRINVFVNTPFFTHIDEKLLKLMINCVISRYIQHLDQCLLWLSEYLWLNSRVNHGLAYRRWCIRPLNL